MVGNVVEEFKIGNTKVKICDDFCRNKSQADIDAILHRIAMNAQPILSYAQTKK